LVVGSQEPSQQSLLREQVSPLARQKFEKVQRPPVHSPEQQLLLPVQTSPSVPQLPFGAVAAHLPPTQWLLQQSLLTLHACRFSAHAGALAHTPPTQASEQQSAAALHVLPAARHSPGVAQRLTPSIMSEHWLEQHALFELQVSPTSAHADAGWSHLPATQLSEQQSVLSAQG
jgi:hypothetical protein